MNQGDRAWHYSPGPSGTVRRVALVVGLHDSGDMERVNLHVYPTNGKDLPMVPGSYDAIPVRYHYKEGGPVDTPFCTPVESKPTTPSGVQPIKPQPVAKPAQTR